VSRPRIMRGIQDLLKPALKHGKVRRDGGGR